jgi:hypothetical protein
MHTRQDRRIQTELAFTLAKNATKPNPFDIISPQNTREYKNWKTEETLARRNGSKGPVLDVYDDDDDDDYLMKRKIVSFFFFFLSKTFNL